MAPDPGTDRVAATLAGIRERSAAALEFPLSGLWEGPIRCCTQSAMDVPLLLAAVERLSKLADEWDNEAVRQDAVAARSAPGGSRATLASGRAQAHRDCADALRGVVTRGLTAERGDGA